jgi:hemerythrin-like domain-containing protein
MLRNKNLIPLSHQHQRALALCVRVDRASPIPKGDLQAWQAEIAQLFRTEIGTHFAAEEQVLFPEERRFYQLQLLADELAVEHVELSIQFGKAESRIMSAEDLLLLSRSLSAHIRKEERQLFEGLQAVMSEEELANAGRRLGVLLKETGATCILPNEATRLRAVK